MKLAFDLGNLLLLVPLGLRQQRLDTSERLSSEAFCFVQSRLLAGFVSGQLCGDRGRKSDHRIQIIRINGQDLVAITENLIDLVHILRGHHRIGVSECLQLIVSDRTCRGPIGCIDNLRPVLRPRIGADDHRIGVSDEVGFLEVRQKFLTQFSLLLRILLVIEGLVCVVLGLRLRLRLLGLRRLSKTGQRCRRQCQYQHYGH